MWYFTGLDFIIRYFLGRLDVNFGLGPQSGIGIENFDLRFQNRSALDNYVGNNYCVCTNNYRAKSSGQFMLLYLHKCFGNTCRTLVIDLLRWRNLRFPTSSKKKNSQFE
ncbi:unnamed protein product [Rhizophagus irregularis]|nr:unnamed protein product [Rhizophagus irregularis]